MNLVNYIDYFHDGSIINIEQIENNMVITMKSAEISDKIKDSKILLSDKRIKGKLHIEGISTLIENKKHETYIKKKQESATILDFEIQKNKIELGVLWSSYSSSKQKDFSTIEIKAKKIYWENIPNLN